MSMFTEKAGTRFRKPGALSRPLTPSAQLAAIVGDEPLARTEIVKRVWDYIKEHGLQDPADKREIVADDKLRAVFGQDRVNMMRMMDDGTAQPAPEGKLRRRHAPHVDE